MSTLKRKELASFNESGRIVKNFQGMSNVFGLHLEPNDTHDGANAAPAVLLAYLESFASVTGQIKVWDGASWVAKPVKVWSGAAWVTKPVKYYNGGWVTTTY
jgi:hypothetical protein